MKTKFYCEEINTFVNDDGIIVSNFRRKRPNSGRLERFLAFKLNTFGIAQILGYETRKTIGIGDVIKPNTNEVLRETTIYNYGFQRTKP